ncbi:MAG: TolC family protein [Candidatus Zixiibacteriota bacterium]
MRYAIPRRLASALVLALAVINFGLADTSAASEKDDAMALARETGSGYSDSKAAMLRPGVSLNDFLIYGALNNPGLKAAYYNWVSELEKVAVVGGLPDPTVSYGYFIKNVETRVGPQNQRFGMQQSIPWFGTLGKRGDAAFESAQAAYQNYQSEKLRLFYSITRAYNDYYYLGRNVEIARDNLELLRLWESVATTKYKAGISPYADLIKIQVELGKLDDQLTSLEEMKRPLEYKLRSALDLPDSLPLPGPTSIANSEFIAERDSVTIWALRHNPNLNALNHLLSKEEIEISLANRARLPNFTLGADYIETGEAVNPGLAENGKDPWMVSVSLNVPIWFGKNNARVRQAQARRGAAENRLADSRNQIEAYISWVLFEYDDAVRKIGLYEDGLIPKAEQSLNASYTAYQSGESDFLNLLDAQRELLEFQLNLEKARTDASTKLAEIEMTIGKDISNPISKSPIK